ncbi:hypothetical protein WJE81_005150, partial [Escherichia coli]
MLDITTITRQNVTSVVGYYSDAKDDYYSKDSSFTSWGTVAKLAMRQPFVLFKGLTFQKLC